MGFIELIRFLLGVFFLWQKLTDQLFSIRPQNPLRDKTLSYLVIARSSAQEKIGFELLLDWITQEFSPIRLHFLKEKENPPGHRGEKARQGLR